MKKRLILIAILFSTVVYAADFTATIDRNSLSENETFRLMLTLEGATTEAEPDFSPLLSEFTILSTAKSTQVSMVNQEKTSQMQWVLDLAPKEKGTWILPAISLGSYTTKPLTLTVNKASSTQSASRDKIFVEVSAHPQDPYVSGQVLYTVKLYYAVPFENASLTDPVANNAVVKRLQDDFTYRTVFHHGRYAVLERHYAIFPQTTDPFTIEPPRFVADLLQGGPSSAADLFFSGRGETIHLSGKPITLQVQPKPAEISTKEWLPAEDVKITEDWSEDSFPLQVGKPITRTLHIVARGAAGELLPSLSNGSKIGAFSVYPEAPVVKTETDGKGMVSERVEKMVLIPTQSGEVGLPAVEVPWWNTVLRRAETARLPGRTLSIAASLAVRPSAKEVRGVLNKSPPAPLFQRGESVVPTQRGESQAISSLKRGESVPPFVEGGLGGIYLSFIGGIFLFALIVLAWKFRSSFKLPKKKKPDDELPPLFLDQ